MEKKNGTGIPIGGDSSPDVHRLSFHPHGSSLAGRVATWAGGIAILLGAIVLALRIGAGASTITWGELFNWMIGREIDARDAQVLTLLRLPRALMAVIAGAILASAGVVYQALLRNPLASPYTLGVSGGATFGAVLSVALTVGVETEGIARLLLGLGFASGFILVILSGSALFTEINVLLPEMFLSRPRDLCRRCWRFWLIVYAGNAAGALFVGVVISGAHLLGVTQEERLFEILHEKMELKELGTEGWFAVLLSGVLGNWLVGMAAFLATAARTVSGKILGILFPIVLFVAIGAQHSPANMGYFSVGLIEGGSGIGWGEAIWYNIVPASLGNLIGGSVLVGSLFWYTYGRHAKGRQSLRDASQLARQQQEHVEGR